MRTRPQRLWAFASGSGLTFLLLLIIAALLAALYDIAKQLIQSDRASRISDVIITFGTYVVVGVVGIAIVISRTLSSKAHMASIPKGYIPTGEDDVPKPAYELISNEYDRAAVIAHISQPRGRKQQGWGRPGTNFENVHFRTAILSTVPVLQSVLEPYLPTKVLSSRASSLSPLSSLVSMNPSPIPPALNPLVELYEQYLMQAKYEEKEPAEEDWDNVVKIVAVLVGVLGVGQTVGESQEGEVGRS